MKTIILICTLSLATTNNNRFEELFKQADKAFEQTKKCVDFKNKLNDLIKRVDMKQQDLKEGDREKSVF